MLAALGIAVVLSTFLIYSALAGSGVTEPVIDVAEIDERADEAMATTVELTGMSAGPISGTRGERITFFMTDQHGGDRLEIDYRGSVPDAFRSGRHVMVKGTLTRRDGEYLFRAKPDTLVTKCPSKYQSEEDMPAGMGDADATDEDAS